MLDQPQPLENVFDSAGPMKAPAIVLIHGSVVTRKMWLPQLRGLSDVYHVLAPDLPGHGALAQMPFTFAAAAESLAEIIRQEACGRALVAGLSLGGYVAMELARSSPHLVAGLVLSGCSLNFTGALSSYLKFVSWLMQRGWLKLRKEQAEVRVKRMFPPWLVDVAETQLRAGVYPEQVRASHRHCPPLRTPQSGSPRSAAEWEDKCEGAFSCRSLLIVKQRSAEPGC